MNLVDEVARAICDAQTGDGAWLKANETVTAALRRQAEAAIHACARAVGLEELETYRSAAMYDAMMNGPRFKGWNRSALDRARAMTEQVVWRRN